MDSVIDEIKNRLDIVDVIGSYIKLQKTGANYRALCPFHAEKTPSFFVSPTRQIWHCFGCSEGGDIFKFVMKIEGVEFGDALRILAQKAGVELKPKSKEWKKLKTERQKLYDICEFAAKFFEAQLQKSSSGKLAKDYLINRGLTEETIKKWRLGFAPDTWHGLSDFLVGKGYTREEIVNAGLAIKKESTDNAMEENKKNQETYDRFRGRIMFPIFDLNSLVIGFGGRVFGKTAQDPNAAKYINTPNTLLYDKSKVLYGLDKAKIEIRKKDFCILVEGYMDVLMSHQAGFENTVAASGTALTPYQLNILKRYSDNLVLGFDMDIAGNKATERGIDLAQKFGFKIKIALMPHDKDPADVLSRLGKDEWQKIIDQSKSIMEFYFDSAFSSKDPEKIADKLEISKIILPVIKRIPNKIEQSYWLQELSKRIKIKEEDLIEEMKKIKIEPRAQVSEPILSVTSSQKPFKKGRRELLEEEILLLIFLNNKLIDSLNSEIIQQFSTPKKEILLLLKENPGITQDNLFKKLKNNESAINFLNYIILKADIEKDKERDIIKDFNDSVCQFKTLLIKNELNELLEKVKEAERNQNFKLIQDLTEKINNLAKELKK